ncbi:MarR family transcriptional regulator [Roseibium polysiphoniae]|uniref:MarR family transcriptional regulator n=1 Tax=Roseibium polysiphoniae TaxID=2571221 RepID=A0A944CFT4_9HYPH|nr:MarR family transcriptional regulator [Roseibium polysiphoniae]MBS8262033.1 MarR family transcriptional regulator [Roseibium polysiphoniae]
MKPPVPQSVVTLMIVDIARLLRKRFEIALTHVDTGLTVAEARTLTFIWRHQGLRQAALAERMSVEPMTLVGYLDSLETAGLIKRTIDPADRRAKLITLTDTADPVIGKIEDAIIEVRSETLAGMSERQRDEMEAILGTMKDNLLNGEAGKCVK